MLLSLAKFGHNRPDVFKLLDRELDSEFSSVSAVSLNYRHKDDEDGHLTNRDRDKAKMFTAFFASVFNMDDGPRGPQCPELEDHDCESDQFPFNPEIVWDLLFHLDLYKSIGSDGIHPRSLKELQCNCKASLDDFRVVLRIQRGPS
ncbi:hypothetical protein BTVI_76342 [Pitangus sulphuratus]|nr:hypothetical protein BTVI_76342 [Pitangus sulphuratus]